MPAKTIVPKYSLSILVSFRALPLLSFDNPHSKEDKSTCQGKFTNCYNCYTFLQLPQKGTQKGKHYTKPRSLSIGENPNY